MAAITRSCGHAHATEPCPDSGDRAGEADAAELVLRDLVDTLLQENRYQIADMVAACASPREEIAPLGRAEVWCTVPAGRGTLLFRGRDGGTLQRYRLSRGPVWYVEPGEPPRVLTPDEVLTTLANGHGHLDEPAEQVAADLRVAVEHTAATVPDRFADLATPAPGEMLAGERLAATRCRPFHPTARAIVGWSVADLERYGPGREHPVALDWVAVRHERLRYGTGTDAVRLARHLLDDADRGALSDAMVAAGLGAGDYATIPVHPWQFDRVLPAVFGTEIASNDIIPLARSVGRFHPTSSLRTLATSPESEWHLKLPLGVETLGITRLLPPKELDNAQRAQATMRHILERDQLLASMVVLSEEHHWCTWGGDDEFADRPGQLAVQLRRYPRELLDDPAAVVLPMAALAAHEWDAMAKTLAGAGFDPGDPAGFFRTLSEAFCELAFGFLRHGVVPELHGQNVLVELVDGNIRRFVLRDYDTLRVCPEWMRIAGTPDPGYRTKGGGTPALALPGMRELVGYLQTLGVQVNLYSIIDAMTRYYGMDERVLWSQLRQAVRGCLSRIDLARSLATLLETVLLREATWPSRQVLGPLLEEVRTPGMVMPASAGHVPNPLLPGPAHQRGTGYPAADHLVGRAPWEMRAASSV
ncbi:siderophore staphylobactin biosynthesis protein SbnC [Haloechinothrix sp. YIM 98757]|uniref:Siderophore staphylobactin biosynthesis protein SbnC n=1 Tax=Haloechinothrix aidingensis TaxID=2752311 RepID=A0A838A406_9PSEU|nr:IucA/IucC family protein [Haloechinothrix aidingensis]MBA0124300.1 siderophore staphylobactin biosynthesis protein SbnC [Haloechinothrix aidingensis]